MRPAADCGPLTWTAFAKLNAAGAAVTRSPLNGNFARRQPEVTQGLRTAEYCCLMATFILYAAGVCKREDVFVHWPP